jgi:gliding motility-associated-like protein
MNRILIIVLCLLAYCTNVSAQTYYTVTALSGTQTVGGNTVTVTSTGNVSTVNYCGTDPYWIGGPSTGPGSYTYTFASPVSNIRVRLTAMNDGEIISFTVNGSPYTLTTANIATFLGSCGQVQAVLSGGNLFGPPGTPSTPGVGAEVNINVGTGITSATVAANGVLAGTAYTFMFNNDMMADATNNGPVCWGDTLKLFGAPTVSGAIYSWTGPGGFTSGQQNPVIPNPSAANAGTYHFTVSAGIITSTDSTVVTMLPKPATPTLTFDNPVCLGSTINLHASTTPAGATFEWWGPWSFSSTSADPSISGATDIHSGVYKAVAEINGCKSDTGTVTINVLHPVTDTINKQICDGDKVMFNSAPVSQPGFYSAVFTGKNGCDSVSNLILQVKPSPNVPIAPYQADDLCVGDSVMLKASGAVSYTWYYGTGIVVGDGAELPVPLRDFSNKIWVVGTGDNGCKTKTEVMVAAKGCCEIMVPNAFTPNADGNNDKFGALSNGNMKNYQMVVYNRWGQVVFTGMGIDNQWDGTINGKVADVGTYHYYITGKCAVDTDISRKGDFVLIR